MDGPAKGLRLTRKRGEIIRIGDDIEIELLSVRLGQRLSDDEARLCIRAPKDVPVHRQEIYEAIQREKEGEGQ